MFDEISYLRDLAKETHEYATSEQMQARRVAWTKQNDLQYDKPLIYIRSIPIREVVRPTDLKCTTPQLRQYETTFLINRFRMTLPDDYIIEPYISLPATIPTPSEGLWGMPCEMTENKHVGDCKAFKPSIMELEDWKQMHIIDYQVDEAESARRLAQVQEIMGDALPVYLNRQTPFSAIWNIDIATALAQLRGLEPLMWDLYDNDEWLHEVLTFMQQNILHQMDLCEQAGGFSSINNQNQAMPYASGLALPTQQTPIASTKEIWGFLAAQEFTGVGPALFKEFMFDYQKPILERFGLVSYGCCEDLTHKIGVIKELSNLRRIAISPFSNAEKCAEQIGKDYVSSWRPNPSTAVATGIDEDFIRSDLRKHFDLFKQTNCIFDITLKDVETQGPDLNGIYKWTHIVREEIERHY